MFERHRQNAAHVVIAHVIVDAEIVAFAGDHHVVVAVIAHLAVLAGVSGRDGTGDGERIALAFLAAEPAAHAPGFDAHGMHGFADGVGDLVLDLGRVLGGGEDVHIAAFLRPGHGGLAFEVEMLLPAKGQLALEAVGGCGERVFGRAFFVDAGTVLESAVGGKRLVDGQDRGLFFNRDLGFGRGLAGGGVAAGDHQEEGLACEMDLARREQRFVMVGGGGVGVEFEVFGGEHGNHIGGSADVCQIHCGDRAACGVREAKGQVQCACGGGDVIDITSRAGDVEGCGVMGEGFGDAHGVTSSTDAGVP